jgi:hypothetical protein
MCRIMVKSRGLVLTCAILVWVIGASQALGQGRTRVQIDTLGNQELRIAAGKNASDVITALNRAAYFNERPDLSALPVAKRAHEDILSRWDDEHFFCIKTRLDRSLVERGEEVYEIRDVPLIFEDEGQRKGILAVNAEGTVIGFRYSDEPATGTLIVTSEPSGSMVASPVGDTLSQTTPARFENVPEGQHKFTIRKEAYETVDTTFVVQAYQSARHTIHLTR